MTAEQKLERDGMRVLGVLYKLTKGRTGVSVDKADLLREVNASGVIGMTDDQFTAWRATTVAEVKAWRAVNAS